MPIYSRDSIGSGIRVSANENYSYADMGRILSECVQNDMTLFNAVLKNDFQENAAIREGTMVSSELTAFREFSAREAWRSLKEKLQKLWEKIKGVFRQVYAKLTVWLVRNGKAFVAMNRKVLANKAGLDSCEIPKFVYLKKSPETTVNTLAASAKGTISSWKTTKYADEITAEQMTNKYLTDALLHNESGAVTVDNFDEQFKKVHVGELTNTTWGAIKNGHSIESLFTTITSKSDSIKTLKKVEKQTDKAIKDAIKAINDAEKKAENDKDEAASTQYKRSSIAVSAFERAITLVTRAGIKAIRDEVKSARQVVGKLVAYSPKKESALMQELAWLEGADDASTMEFINPDDVNDPDVAGDPDVQVNIEVEDDE